LNDEGTFFIFSGKQDKVLPDNGLSHCALNNENENEDDDEYEEERCIRSYSYSSSITAFLYKF
jgi:hypothetical protein